MQNEFEITRKLARITRDEKYISLRKKIGDKNAFIMYLKLGYYDNKSYTNEEISKLLGMELKHVLKNLKESLMKLELDIYEDQNDFISRR
ncbi:MAG: hypothetical protein IJ501_03090 [Bacilli bacterium]|nr:hypothetical protein [Bacilli bacterium]